MNVMYRDIRIVHEDAYAREQNADASLTGYTAMTTAEVV